MASTPPHAVRCLGFSYLSGRKVSRLHLLLLALSDWALLLLLGREKPAPAPPLAGQRIVVAKIDHLGDVMMITPLLRELREQAPGCSVDLLLGSWSRELGEMLRAAGLCREVFYYDAPSLNKGRQTWPAKMARGLATFRDALRRLRGADIHIDLRPFTPNTLLLARLALVPHKIGFGTRGLSFLLQQELPFWSEKPLGDSFLGALDALGLKRPEYRGPSLPKPASTPRLAGGVSLPEGFLVVHPFSRERGKMLPAPFWIEAVGRLASSTPVVILGSSEDRESALAADLETIGNTVSLIGRTSFREAVETMSAAAGFAGVDSIFAHVAVAFDRPAVILLAGGGALRAAFPPDRPGLLIVDLAAHATRPEVLAENLLRLARPA